ncbi:MAG: ATPase, T2SS/T4P/T4SS family, partial [Candidatus Saccharimonadales bacterium]
MPEEPKTPQEPVVLIDDDKLAQVLTEGNFISDVDLRNARAYTATHHIGLFDYFLTQNIIAYDLLGPALAKYYGLEYADLDTYQPSKEHISLIPADVGQTFRAVVYKNQADQVTVATDMPDKPGLQEALAKVFGTKTVNMVYALPDELNEALIHYRKPLVTRFNQIIQQQNRVAPEIIDEIIKDAAAYKVSDIHFEPQESIVLIRFRIDGVLHEAGQLPKQYYDNILNRLKVQSHMRIDEHNV